MEKSTKNYLGSLKLWEVQHFKNPTMVPNVTDYDDGLDYLILLLRMKATKNNTVKNR